MAKIGRNEPCWCGSGKKYKKCHYLRSDEIAHPIGRLLAEIKSKTAHKECLHPESGKGQCSKKVIDAHSIQKSGPLKHIIDDTNHVYTFGIDSNGKEEISKLGWQKASTFKGFCGVHDKAMFSPIEDESYTGSKFQSFIAGYRAYALEYFKKVSVIKGLPFMKENVDRGMSHEEQLELQRTLETMNQGFMKGVEDFKETLNLYVNYHQQQSYDEFKSASFYFSGDLSVVVGGTFAPDFSIDEERIQSLEPGVKFVENLSVNTLNTDKGYAIVFSWPKKYKKCTKFIESLIEVDKTVLPSRLIEIIFSYIENSYFSKAWIDGLDSAKRTVIEAMARNPIQYGEPIKFTDYNYTNWEIERVVLN
ncbi:SEC-C domain-containing protein [uncultured Alteromonas sp.]|uniref:YecA family protein n=1 Tax=uncultured Alteromonas sp. TaxID=179113 RepID=UPI0030EF0CA7|tara:strand:- start:10177 stop:11262 length:1086 start_codon:yes stop_codon:yes gene_type:complete